MAGREFEEPRRYGEVDHSERIDDILVTRKDLGRRFRIGLHDFLCVDGLNGDVALVRRTDEEHIIAFIGEELGGLSMHRSPDTGEVINENVYMQLSGDLWLYDGRLPENLTAMYRHFDAELGKLGR